MTRAAALAAVVLLAASACGGGRARGGEGLVTTGGRIGALQIDRSTPAEVVRAVGRPDLEVTGSFAAAFAGFPKTYRALAYDCSQARSNGFDPGAYRPTHRYCRIVYFVNPRTRRLVGFLTNSPSFHTEHGTKPGMPQAEADRMEHSRVKLGAFIGIGERSKVAELFLGSSCQPTKTGCTGGVVATLEVESRHHPVGLFFE